MGSVFFAGAAEPPGMPVIGCCPKFSDSLADDDP
jgi:hypothetical protein